MNAFMWIVTWLALFFFGLIVGHNASHSPDTKEYVYVLLLETKDKEYIPLSVHNTVTECVKESFRIKEEGDFFMCEKIDAEATL